MLKGAAPNAITLPSRSFTRIIHEEE